MQKYSIIFLSTFAIFVSFLTPNVNTGDAGELIASSYFMGVAHPSGYPLYLQIGKLFSFLPFGNVAFRVSLVSALFSSLSLTILAVLVQRLTENKAAVFFTVVVLLVSYSYFTQSVMAKFYTLNLFFILLTLFLWLNMFLRGYQENALYLTAFIFGLITANHHTGLILGAALVPALYSFIRSISWRTIPAILLLFLCGFLINAYLLVRGGDMVFFNSSHIRSFTEFWRVLLRLDYSSSTIAAAGAAVRDMTAYWYAIRNFVLLLSKNFSLFSFPLLFAGMLYLYKKERRFFAMTLIALCFYGPLLAKLTFAGQAHTGEEYYIIANQYFLPAFAIYSFFAGLGFYQVFLWLKRTDMKILKGILPVVFSVFPLFSLVPRATDSNYRTNYVPYQYTKDMHSILPLNSVFLAYGDNAAYQGWYLKLIGRYREDNCMVSVIQPKGKAWTWTYEGCNKASYGKIYPSVFSPAINTKAPVMVSMRLYGTAMIGEDFIFKRYMRSRVFSLVHIYLPTETLVGNIHEMSQYVDRFMEERTLLADKLINPSVCLSHYTDDNFTGELCNGYLPHLMEMARLYSDKKYGVTGKSVEVYLHAKVLRSNDLYYKIPLTEKNSPYLGLLNLINNHNKWEIFYIR